MGSNFVWIPALVDDEQPRYLALVDAIESHDDWKDAIAAYEAARRDNAAAIQCMALENYVEMRDKVDDAQFLLERGVERELALRHPDLGADFRNYLKSLEI